MRRCTTAYLHRLLVVVVLVIVVLIVTDVIVGRVADGQRVVVIVVAGTEPQTAATDRRDERVAVGCRRLHCAGMRSFCPG
jgi:hypothetical protein